LSPNYFITVEGMILIGLPEFRMQFLKVNPFNSKVM